MRTHGTSLLRWLFDLFERRPRRRRGRLWDAAGRLTGRCEPLELRLLLSNTAPTLGAQLASGSINEGEAATLTVTTDDPDGDGLTLTVDWGDGSTDNYSPAATDSLVLTHQYADDNPSGTDGDAYAVSMSLDDGHGGSAGAAATVLVENVAPTIDWVSLTGTLAGGGVAGLEVGYSEVNANDTLTLVVDWGDGSMPETTGTGGGSGTAVLSHSYGPGASAYPVQVTLSDDDGGSATGGGAVSVTNTAPTLGAQLASGSVNENEPATLTVTTNDVDGDGLTLSVDWGDGSTDNYSPAATDTLVLTHQYVDDNPSGTSADPYAVSLSLSDGQGGSAGAAATVLVENVAPTINGVTLTGTLAGGGVAGLEVAYSEVNANDTLTLEVDWGDGSTETVNTPGGTGTAMLSHSYGPGASAYPVQVTLSDDDQGSATGGGTVSVTNTAPTLGAWLSSGSVNENEPATLTVTTDDPDGDGLTLTVDWGDGSIGSYSPAATDTLVLTHQYADDDPSGTNADPYPVSVSLDDGQGGSVSSNATVTVQNVAPTINGVTLTGTLTGGGVAGLEVSYSEVNANDSLTLVVDWGDGSASTEFPGGGTGTALLSHTYAPGASAYPVQVTLSDDDGGSASDGGTVTVGGTTSATNTAPTLGAWLSSGSVNENEAATLTVTTDDPNGDDLTLTVDWGDGSTESYSPAATDSLVLTHQYDDDDPSGTNADPYAINVSLSDGQGGSVSTNATVTVQNVAPTIDGLSLTTTLAGGGVAGLEVAYSEVNANDTLTLVVDWGDGTVSTEFPGGGTGTAMLSHTYAPGASAYPVQITLSDDDGGSASDGGTVTVGGTSTTNTTPTLGAWLASGIIDEDEQATLTVTTDDPDGDGLTLTVDWGDGSTESYSPAATDSLVLTHQYADDDPSGTTADPYPVSVTLDDGHGGSAGANATVTVQNVAPTIDGLSLTTTLAGGGVAGLEVAYSEVNANDTLTLVVDWGDGGTPETIGASSGSGTATLSHTYAPGASAYPVQVTLSDDDGGSASDGGTVSVTNTAPVAVDDDWFGVLHDEPLHEILVGVLDNDTDADGDPLTAAEDTGPTHGTLQYLMADGTFSYLPNLGYVGTDSFTYTVSDGVATDVGTVTIEVYNDPPTAEDDSYDILHDRILTGNVQMNDSDYNDDSLTASVQTGPDHGILTLNADGTFEYNSAVGFFGTDTFVYALTDGAATSTATVTINVTNSAPMASGDSREILHDQTLAANVMVNDSDGDPDESLTALIQTGPSHGTLISFNGSDGSFEYRPNAFFVGTDTFVYALSDGAASSTATVTIDVFNADPIAAAGGPYTIDGGADLSLDGSGSSDPNPEDDLTLTYEWDLDGDGTTDKTGVSPTVTWDSLYHDYGFRQGETKTITLTVSDGVAEGTDTVNVSVNLPTVSVTGGPDAVLNEHATAPGHGKLTIHRTGGTEESLTVQFTVAGSATNGTDFANVGGTVVIPADAPFVEIPLVTINDLIVEGDESIILALESLPAQTYQIDPIAATGTATIYDNDSWQWTQFAGTELAEGDVQDGQFLPDFDPVGAIGSRMAITGSVSATNNSVSADVEGEFVDVGVLSQVEYLVSDNVDMSFQFDPITGDISVDNAVGQNAVLQDGPLSGAIDYSYEINNDGTAHHTVTVTTKLIVTVEGQLTISTTGGFAVGGHEGSLGGHVGVTIGTITESGGIHTSNTVITLHLIVVEDND